MTKNNRRIRLYVDIFLILGSAFLLLYSYFDAEAGNKAYEGMAPLDFPKFILSLLLVLVIIDLIKEIKAYKSEMADAEKMQEGPAMLPAKAIVAVVSTFIYFMAWKYIGFCLSSVAYISFIGKYLRRKRPWWECLAVGAGFTIIIQLVFTKGFAIGFPEPLWDWIRGY